MKIDETKIRAAVDAVRAAGGNHIQFPIMAQAELAEFARLMGAKITTSVYEGYGDRPFYAIDGCCTRIEGVEIAAQAMSRPATMKEIAVLEEHGSAHNRRSTSMEASLAAV